MFRRSELSLCAGILGIALASGSCAVHHKKAAQPLTTATAATADPAAPPRLRGRIVAPDGNPIAKVEVSTEPETDMVRTRRDGSFEIDQVLETKKPIAPGHYLLKIKLPGYHLAKISGEGMPIDYPGGDYALNDIELQSEEGPKIEPVKPNTTDENNGEENDSGGVNKVGE